jgi:hypothetical protein
MTSIGSTGIISGSAKFTYDGDTTHLQGNLQIDQQTISNGSSNVVFSVTAGSNAGITLNNDKSLDFQDWITGDTGVLVVTQDSTGGHNLTFSDPHTFLGTVGYTPSSPAGAVDILGVYFNGSRFYITVGSSTAAGDTITINANTNNNVLTATGTTGTIQGESNMTFNGSTLQVTGIIRASDDIIAFGSSDRRLKDNILPISNAIEKVKQISGVEFDWNENQTTHSGHDIGVIAQEIEEVFPSLVRENDNGYKQVRYEKLISVLIEAIKELKVEIDQLKQK